jgi:hypothetical protein
MSQNICSDSLVILFEFFILLIFNFSVFSTTNYTTLCLTKCNNLPVDCEEAFYCTYFTEATDVSQQEMIRIVTRHRKYMMSPHYRNRAPNFIIHRLKSDEYANCVSFLFTIVVTILIFNFSFRFFCQD